MIRHEWLAPNGDLISLSDAGSGISMISGGVEGLGMPPTSAFVRESGGLDGQSLRGFKTAAREVFWPILLHRGTRGWDENQARFWASLVPGEYGEWRVTHNRVTRTLQCRYDSGGDAAYDLDPSVRLVEQQGIALVADRPMWRGPLVSRLFRSATSSGSFFAEPGSAHVFNIGSAGNVDQSQFSNPGNVPAWPVITVWGPSQAFTVTVDGAEISATLALSAGERLVIDTDPRSQVVRLHSGGSSELFPFFNFDSIAFAPIPRGASAPVGITVNGSGPIDVAFYPQYWRAF